MFLHPPSRRGRAGGSPLLCRGLPSVKTALAAKRSGWGLQSLAKFQDYDPQITALYDDMFAQRIGVNEYGKQANQLLNQMIEESLKILKITGSKQ